VGVPEDIRLVSWKVAVKKKKCVSDCRRDVHRGDRNLVSDHRMVGALWA
jgi:hypothetical protein